MAWPISESNRFGPSIEELAMEFALSASREGIPTWNEVHVQMLRKNEMLRRIGAERTEAAIQAARETLLLIGINTSQS